MIDIVWVILTITPLVTCNGFATTCDDADMNRFILDEEDSCYKNEWDKIFPRMSLCIDLVKLRMLMCCYYFFLCFGALKFRGRNFYKEG